MDATVLHLKVLRTIAQTQTHISLEDAVKSGNAQLVRLLIIVHGENVSNDIFIAACNAGHTEIVR
jgi:hypothetical protein